MSIRYLSLGLKTEIITFFVFLGTVAPAQYRIEGYVKDATYGINDNPPLLNVSVSLGFDQTTTNKHGFFCFKISSTVLQEYDLKAGDDIYVKIKFEGYVTLEPANGNLRLPDNPDIQAPFTIRLVKKGSLKLLESEELLLMVLQKRINAAVDVEKEKTKRNMVLVQEAARLGFSEEELKRAVDKYKEDIRESEDFFKKGLVALDDAHEAYSKMERDHQLELAIENTRSGIRKDLQIVAKAEEASKRLPVEYITMAAAFYEKTNYDSALVYALKADSLYSNNIDIKIVLGNVLVQLAYYDRAFDVYLDVFRASNALDNPDPYVAGLLNNVGVVLQLLGHYDMSIEYLMRSVEISSGAVAVNDPVMAEYYSNLGSAWEAKGEYGIAYDFYTKATAIDSAVFGMNHSSIARDFNNLGGVLESREEHEKAIEFFTKAMVIDSVIFGMKHPNITAYYNNLGYVWYSKDKYDKAIDFFKKALMVDSSVFGMDHPNVGRDYYNLGLALNANREYDRAIGFFRRSMAIDSTVFGMNHPNIAILYSNLGSAWCFKGNHDKAIYFIQKSIAIDSVILGINHPRVASSYGDLGYVWYCKGEYDLSIDFYSKAIAIDSISFGTSHTRLATSYNNVGNSWSSKKNYDKAINYLTRAKNILMEKLGVDHPKVITIDANLSRVHNEYGMSHYQGQRFNAALAQFIQAINYARASGNNFILLTSYSNVGSVLRCVGRNQDALEILLTGIALAKEHPVKPIFELLPGGIQTGPEAGAITNQYIQEIQGIIVNRMYFHVACCLVELNRRDEADKLSTYLREYAIEHNDMSVLEDLERGCVKK